MCDNGNLKVFVDDDYLDLRNDQSKSSRIRPMSGQSVTRGSSSINTRGNVKTVKEVLPGLKKILNNYNPKNTNTFTHKRNNQQQAQQIDSRFRRKVEKKALSSRSESLLQENESTRKETTASHSSDISTHDHSSGSENRYTSQLETKLSPKEDKFSKTKLDTEFSKFKIKRVENHIFEKQKNEKNERVKNAKNESKRTVELQPKVTQDDIKKQLRVKEDNKEGKDLDVKKVLNEDLGKVHWVNRKFESHKFYPFPTFRKSWTVPSLPLLKRSFSWTRHHNVLCAKVDRKTYEFDTDDTISETEDDLSAYSTRCLCGIFLIGGILTASEIQADFFRPPESEEGMMEFFYVQVSYTFHVIFNVFYQIITFPSTKLFRTSVEQPKYWGVFDKYLYFVPE
ncbi:uncharacterized protein LOC123307610 isoform X2 [Coccinella septempunctata]|uniref:uncharacterized protein LOC123307610 isoform X2 n=1 Tax=Coccinella septempunctata TaxID=41139 RepID=UPI001D087A17|nr:uncharacterized protein LOC123307610 isoform X2 [Coccinella septempunctata]